MERKKIQKETNDFLEVMQIPKPTTQEEWRAVWKEVGTLLAAKHFISHTPVPVMDLPIAAVVDSKEHLRFRAMCDERISFPFEELREFPDVYAKLAPYVAADSFVEVKVAWRCNTEQWCRSLAATREGIQPMDQRPHRILQASGASGRPP